MTKDSIRDYSATPSLNRDISGINIEGTAVVSNFDNALRTLMAHLTLLNAVAPDIAANTMLVDNPEGTARETKTFTQVNERLGTFETKAAAEAAVIPDGIGAVRLAGEDDIGDFGDGLYRKVTEDGSPLQPAQFRTNVNLRRWENAEPILDCAAFFGVRSGATPSVVRQGINDALSESARLGRPARLPPATVTINARLLPPSGSSLFGFGRHSVVQMDDGANANMLEAVSETGISLRDFVIDGNRDNQAAGGGISFDTVDDFDILRVKIRDVYSNGMLLRDVSDGLVVDNRLDHCGSDSGDGHGTHAISVAYDTVVGTSRDLVITRNRIRDPYGSGINMSGAFNCTVQDNVVVQTGDHDFDNGYGGVRFSNGAERNVAQGNVINGMGRGLFVVSTAGRHNSLIGNVIRAAGQEGILAQSSGTLVHANKIYGAGVTVPGVAGIKINETPTGCQVTANEVINTGSGMDYGIDLNTTTARHIIKDNVIEGYQIAPIRSLTPYFKAGGNIWPGYEGSIAVASTLALPLDADLIPLSGTGTITDITGGYFGCKTTLRVPTGATITDGGNLRLAGDMVGGTGRTITLTKTGSTSWEEISRSLN